MHFGKMRLIIISSLIIGLDTINFPKLPIRSHRIKLVVPFFFLPQFVIMVNLKCKNDGILWGIFYLN